MNLLEINISVKTINKVIFLSIVSLINPLFAIIFCFVFVYNEKNNDALIYFLYALIALYLGLINSTKVPVSDLLNYKDFYDDASMMSFGNYIFILGKATIFFVMSFILNKAFFGNFDLYIIFLTFLMYFLVFISIHKYWRNQENRFHILFFAVLIFGLFHPLFGYSSHLIRQILAGSLFILFIINKDIKGQYPWIIAIFAVLIHASAGILFLISFLPGIQKRLNLKRTIILTLSIFTLVYFGNELLVFFYRVTSGIPIFRTVFHRLINLQPFSDQRDFVVKGSMLFRRGIPFFLLITMLFVYFKKDIKDNSYHIINVFIIFYIFLESLYNLGFLFFHLRLTAYVYLFIPFLIPHIFASVKSKKGVVSIKIVESVIVFLMIINFYSYLNRSNWEYDSIVKLILQPTFLYFVRM